MLQDGERPQWAAEHERVIEYEQGGVTYHIPPSVKERLDAPLGAVPGAQSRWHPCTRASSSISSLLPGIPDYR